MNKLILLSLFIIFHTSTFSQESERKAGYDLYVKQAQQYLNNSGYNPGPIDGLLGGKTVNAIREYQREQEIPETGKLDQATLEKMGITFSQSTKNDESDSGNSGKSGVSYAECIRKIVDKHLLVAKTQVKEYQYGVLPNKKGFGGKVVYKSGSILYVEQKEESSALTLFSQCIADFTSGLNWVSLKNEIQNLCKPGS